jgi:hypothetical protein
VKLADNVDLGFTYLQYGDVMTDLQIESMLQYLAFIEKGINDIHKLLLTYLNQTSKTGKFDTIIKGLKK